MSAPLVAKRANHLPDRIDARGHKTKIDNTHSRDLRGLFRSAVGLGSSSRHGFQRARGSDDPRRQYSFDFRDSADETCAHRAVRVDQRVGILCARLIKQVRDIESRGGKTS